jgi:hypothetical protein
MFKDLPSEIFRPNDRDKKVNDQNHSQDADNRVHHGQSLSKAFTSKTQRPKKITVTTQ